VSDSRERANPPPAASAVGDAVETPVLIGSLRGWHDDPQVAGARCAMLQAERQPFPLGQPVDPLLIDLPARALQHEVEPAIPRTPPDGGSVSPPHPQGRLIPGHAAVPVGGAMPRHDLARPPRTDLQADPQTWHQLPALGRL
jgi:hypothetical protein